MSEFASYVGIPWEAGARGPNSYDCMAFFRHVQAKHFGIALPEVVVPDYDDGRALVDLFANHKERLNWLKVSDRRHGDAVIVHRPLHIGTWLDIDGGGVLHCVRGAGVVFTLESSWFISGFGRKDFFRHIE